MKKQIYFLVALTLLLVSTAIAQKNKSDRNQPQPSPSPQISLEKRLVDLSKDISNGLTENQKTTVAIADFVDLNNNTSDFGKFLAEELVTRLYVYKNKFKVIERQRLDKVIAEQKLSLTEIIEASSAKRIGRILGVEAIVAGTITELGNSFRVNARIINTETGELLAAAGATISKDQEVCSLINCGSKTIVPTLPIISPATKIQPTPTPKPTIVRRDADFFAFDLQSCKLSGTSVMCEFIVTNNDKDRSLAICISSEIYDDFNNRVRASSAELANLYSDGTGCVRAFLVSGVATKARLAFNKVSPEATKITLFKLTSRSDKDLDIQYRNISLR